MTDLARTAALIALFPVRYYAYLTEPAPAPGPAAVRLPANGGADIGLTRAHIRATAPQRGIARL
jgi:hypothetical protein